MGAVAARWGFDPARLTFALRTALAGCLALLVAWLLGLEHPQWSAMTVWAASQPVRGALLEKSFFRGAGTLVGVLAGVLLVVLSHGQPLVLVVGLALWIGLCAGLGNVLRGFVSYGSILAGYSASMVALLDAPHPDRIVALGIDRFATVLVGVVVAMLVGLLFTPGAAEEVVAARARRLTVRVLRGLAARLDGHSTGPGGGLSAEEQHALLAEMAAIDDGLDPHGAGSLRSRRSARTHRAILIAQVSALLWLRRAAAVPPDPAVAEALSRAARALEEAAPHEVALAALRQTVELSAGLPALNATLVRLETALRDRLGVNEREVEPAELFQSVTLHRDWVGARHASIRATGTMLVVGGLWLLSGWSGGAFVLLGTSVMISLFSTFDNPAGMMRFVFLGQLAGAAAALACRWLVWPLATGEAGLVFLLMPFILVGALPVAHRRTLQGGFDYNLVMLLLLAPVHPLTGSFPASLATALAVVAAPLVALVAFRFAFPANAGRRLGVLIAMMVHELQDMAADPGAPAHAPVWRARLYHRLLRLVSWVEKAGERGISATGSGLAVLQLGGAILRMHELLRDPALSPAAARGLTAALERMRRIGAAPERAQRALDRAARRLAPVRPSDAAALGEAAAGLADNLGFFHRAATPGRG